MARLDPKPVEALGAAEARALFVRAQALDRPPGESEPLEALVRRLGAVQLDTISVLARSHELVAYARLGPMSRTEIEKTYWDAPARTFEYIGHSGSIMPVELWPYFAFRRRAVRHRNEGHTPPSFYDEVLAHLREGPVTTTDVGGGRSAAGWWNWSDAKRALEGLYRRGEVAITVRQGWKRVYDLPERVLPKALLDHELTDEECYAHLVQLSAKALGVGTKRDIADYFRLTTRWMGGATHANELVDASIEAAGLVPVSVEGWPETAFADPEALAAPPPQPARTTLLSPFDSLIWASPRSGELKERERIRRVFGFSYSFEAYVRPGERNHGYFTMPLLHEGRLVGRIDPKRDGRTLIARSVSLEEPEALRAMASALREAASWVGCDDVRVEQVRPVTLAKPLAKALA